MTKIDQVVQAIIQFMKKERSKLVVDGHMLLLLCASSSFLQYKKSFEIIKRHHEKTHMKKKRTKHRAVTRKTKYAVRKNNRRKQTKNAMRRARCNEMGGNGQNVLPRGWEGVWGWGRKSVLIE